MNTNLKYNLRRLGALLAAVLLLGGCKTPPATTKDAASLKEEAIPDTGRADKAEQQPLTEIVDLTEEEPLETEKEPDVTAATQKPKKKGKKKGDEAILKSFKTISPFGPDSALYPGKKEGLGNLVGPDSNVGGVGLHGGVGLEGGGETAPSKKEKKK